MPIVDWLSYPPPLYINIGFGLSNGAPVNTEPDWSRLDHPDAVLPGTSIVKHTILPLFQHFGFHTCQPSFL